MKNNTEKSIKNKKQGITATAALRCLIALLCLAALLVSFAGCNGKNQADTTDPAITVPGAGEKDPSGSDTAGTVPSGTESGGAVTDAPEPKENRLSFVACGDNIIHECVYLDAATRATALAATSIGGYAKSYYFNSMYTGVASVIKDADVAFINAEGPMGGSYLGVRGYPSFNAPDEAGEALVDLGFDIINLANNHMLDIEYVGSGLYNTIQYWKNQPVMTVGGYESRADYDRIRVYEENGVKLAVLSFTYGTNNTYINPAYPEVYIPVIDRNEIIAKIAEAKKLADAVIVSMHWGNENKFDITGEQESVARLIADCGADVIIGHHPHVLQPMKWITGASGNKTLCIYSLGNFVNTQLYDRNMVGGFISFDVVKNADGTAIENACFLPTVCHYTANPAQLDSQELYMRYDVQMYLLKDYTEELCAAHGAQYYTSPRFNLSTLRGYVTRNIPAEFLTKGY